MPDKPAWTLTLNSMFRCILRFQMQLLKYKKVRQRCLHSIEMEDKYLRINYCVGPLMPIKYLPIFGLLHSTSKIKEPLLEHHNQNT